MLAQVSGFERCPCKNDGWQMVEGSVWNVVVVVVWGLLVPNWTAVNGVWDPTQREKEEVTILNLWLHVGEGEKGYPYILWPGPCQNNTLIPI
tara:strand:+ start:132 stop:407 length:276 start_codon:yes stop_codon:yes gene_type:complete